MRLVTQNIRQKQLLKMGNAFSSVLTEQHSPSSSCHLRCHIRCHSGFLEMKQRVGLTLHTYLVVGTYVFQGETRYILNYLHVTLQPWIYCFELCNQSLSFVWICNGIYVKPLFIETCGFSQTYLYFISFLKQHVVQGTTFVLQKSADPRQMLLSAISAGTGVKEVCYYTSDVR
jgi:hypothetical protein